MAIHGILDKKEEADALRYLENKLEEMFYEFVSEFKKNVKQKIPGIQVSNILFDLNGGEYKIVCVYEREENEHGY